MQLTPDFKRFLGHLKESTKEIIPDKNITAEEKAYCLGIYQLADTLANPDKDNEVIFELNYDSAKALYKAQTSKKNITHKQLSLDDIYPEMFKALDELNKRLNKLEKKGE